jgi:hypothetical protein
LLSNIVEAHEQGANYLSGGIGIFKYAVQVAMNRYWVSNVLGIRFIILYKNIFDKILNEPYDENINADILLSDLTSNKMILFPFISVQKKIDLSDANPSHHETKELSTHFFEESAQIMERIDKAYRKYQPF